MAWASQWDMLTETPSLNKFALQFWFVKKMGGKVVVFFFPSMAHWIIPVDQSSAIYMGCNSEKNSSPIGHLGGFNGFLSCGKISGFDVILEKHMMPEVEEGEWILWRNMGAYTSAVAWQNGGAA